MIAVEKALEQYGAPIYVRHEIVHNKYVVQTLEKKGAIFVERTEEVPEGNIVMFSAHGVAPVVHEEAAAGQARHHRRDLPARHQGPQGSRPLRRARTTTSS